MCLEENLALVDQYVAESDEYVRSIQDDFMKTRFTGFLSVNAVTIYELCIKSILVEFSHRKDPTFGFYIARQYERMNGRIRLADLVDLAGKFGSSYKDRFKEILANCEQEKLESERASVRQAYTQLVDWRHEFAHKGSIPTNATYDEAKKNYCLGKEVIRSFGMAMSGVD